MKTTKSADSLRAATCNNLGFPTWKTSDLCASYNWPSNLLGNGIIAVYAEQGLGWVMSDMLEYFTGMGMPIPTIIDVPVTTPNGTGYNTGTSVPGMGLSAIETTMDIQISATSFYVATGRPATIRVYWTTGNSDGTFSPIAYAINQAANDGCSTFSSSYATFEGSDALFIETAATSACAKGMAIFAGSGDGGAYGDNVDGVNVVAVDGMAACPHVVGCGGTTKFDTSETAWSGSGGGYSTTFPVQSWQVGVPTPQQALIPGDTFAGGSGRMVPDVSASASGNSCAVYWTSPMYPISWWGAGGTSAVAPLYAGLFAAFPPLSTGFIGPILWQNKQAFVDVTQGDNGLYRALNGPDPCTGLGFPNGAALASVFPPQARPNGTTTLSAAGYSVNGLAGVSRSITYGPHTLTVTNGLITSIA